MKYKIRFDWGFWHIDLIEDKKIIGGFMLPGDFTFEEVKQLAERYVELQNERDSNNPG